MSNKHWKLLGILLIAWAILTIRVGDRFADAREAPHVWIPAAIRTIDTLGVDTVGLMMTRNTAPITNPDEIIYYSHHPAMMVWLPLLSTRILGFHEVGVRYPFIVVTLLTICVLYVFVRRLFGEKIAVWAAFFYAIAPYTAYFGRIPAPDVVGFLWVMLYALVIVDWLRHPKPRHVVILAILVWLAVWTAWTAVFFIAALGVTAMILGQRQHRIAVIGFGGLAGLAFFALIIFYQLQWPGSIDSILEAYVWRSSTATYQAGSETFTIVQWITKNLGDVIIFATGGIVFLGLPGLLALRSANRLAKGMLLGLFAGSLSYQLAFLNASYVHDVDKASFTLVLAILAALGVDYCQAPRHIRWGRPVWQVLTVITIVQGLLVTGAMHYTANSPLLDQLIELSQTAPEDAQIAVKLPPINDETSRVSHMVVQYYAYRTVLWDVDQSEAQAAVTDQPVFYIDCTLAQDDAAPGSVTCQPTLIE